MFADVVVIGVTAGVVFPFRCRQVRPSPLHPATSSLPFRSETNRNKTETEAAFDQTKRKTTPTSE